MTNAQVLEAVNMHVGNFVTTLSVYLTLTFAYLTVIYLVGERLSKVQLVIVSCLYVVWAAVFSAGAITHLISHDSLIATYPHVFTSFMWHLPWATLGTVIVLLGSLASLFFAYDVRKKGSI